MSTMVVNGLEFSFDRESSEEKSRIAFVCGAVVLTPIGGTRWSASLTNCSGPMGLGETPESAIDSLVLSVAESVAAAAERTEELRRVMKDLREMLS